MAKKSSTTQDSDDVTALRKALDEANSRVSAAEGRANQEASRRREAELQGMSAQERALVSQLEACDSNISAKEGELQSFEDQIAALADEPGHGKEIAALNRKMAQTSAQLETENQRKTYLSNQRDQFKAKKESRTEEHDTPAGDTKLPNGALLSSFSARTQAWLKDRPDTLTSPAAFDRVVAFAKAAQAKGIKNDSNEFFAYVEDQMGETRQDDDEDEDQDEGEEIADRTAGSQAGDENYEAERPQRRAAGPGSMAAAAPSAKIPAGSGGGNRRTPTLTAEEREVALNLYSHLNITDADKMKKYADGKKFMNNYKPQHFQGPN